MTVGQIWTDSNLEGADGELYVIGVVASDGWDVDDNDAQVGIDSHFLVHFSVCRHIFIALRPNLVYCHHCSTLWGSFPIHFRHFCALTFGQNCAGSILEGLGFR